jgi:TonB-linked SusC/RagA family outer membrane protein
MYKSLLIMKLIILLLTTAILQVSANTYAQKITLNRSNVPLEKVMKEIRTQSGYDFFYDLEFIKNTRPVSINLKDATIEQALEQSFAGQSLTYSISNKIVIIKEKLKSTAPVALIDLRGRVIDETGKPLAGASVRVKSSTSSAQTNEGGEFSLLDLPADAVIVITYVGYAQQEIKVQGQNTANLVIAMKPESNNLTDINIVSNGYQTISKERSAGSFTKVDMTVVSNRTTSMNILQSLDGLVPGLVVNNAPNRSQLMIRGIGTTGGTTGTGTTSQPLYVVDGLAVPITNPNDNFPDIILSINPQDVESITVLKDATAASIWGARAANGVIVITTKKGAFNTKLKINYNGFVNFQGKPNLDYQKLLNSRQYIDVAKEIMTPAYFAQYPYSTVNTVIGGGITPLEYLYYNNNFNPAQAQLDGLAGFDNRQQIKDLFYRDALLSNHTLSLSGGGDKYTFYGSGSYTNTVSTVPGDKNNNYKINIRQDFKFNNRLSVYLLTDLTYNKNGKKRNLDINYYNNPYQMFRDANGNNLSVPSMTGYSNDVLADASARARVSLDYNPLNEFDYGSTNGDNLLARLNTGFKLNIVKGLRAEGTYGFIKGKNTSSELESIQSYLVRKEVASFAVAASPSVVPRYYLPTTGLTGGRLTTVNGDQRKWDIRHQLIYDFTKDKHALTVLAGQEAQENFTSFSQSRIRGFDPTLLTSATVDYPTIAGLVTGVALPLLSGVGSSMGNDSYGMAETTSRYTSYYGNLGYTYDRKYTLNLSWRNDQSNLFGKDKSAQNKPIYAIGTKWAIGNEDFMKSVTWVQGLALRATYGITGNSPEAGIASSQDIIRPASNTFFQGGIGTAIQTPGNPDLSWERTASTNIGLDFSVLNDRLSANIDLYSRKSTDLLGLIYPNSFTGFPLGITGNSGDITNKGIEVMLHSVNISSQNFNWSTNWTFAYNKSNTVNISSFTQSTTGAGQVDAIAKLGYPAYPLFAYRYGGLDNTGAPQVILADGTVSTNPTITKADDLVYMGTTQPVYNGGLSNNFQYKAFTLSANMVYNLGHVMRRTRNLAYGGQFRRNVSVDFLNRWKAPGDEAFTNIPAFRTTSTPVVENNYFEKGDVNVVSASFVKLRDVTLFYDLPKSLVNRIQAQGISFRVQLSNVMLWTKNKYGMDPEFYGANYTTNQHTVTLGINVSL